MGLEEGVRGRKEEMILAQDLITLSDYISKGGFITLLVIIIITGWRGMWVSGHEYTRQLKEANERTLKVEKELLLWRDMALKGAGIAEAALRDKTEGGIR